MIVTRAITNCSIDNFNPVNIGIMLGNCIKPGCNSFFGFVHVEPIQPVRKMCPFQQIAELERHASFPPTYNSPTINSIAFRKIVYAAFFFNGSPCACVIRGNLVPVGVVIFGDCLTINNDVTEVLFCTGGEASPVTLGFWILEIFFEPGHRWAINTVFDKT